MKYQLPSKGQTAKASKILGPTLSSTLSKFSSSSTSVSLQGDVKDEKEKVKIWRDFHFPVFECNWGFDAVPDNASFESEIPDDVLAKIILPSSSSNFDFDILDDVLANITLPSSSSNFAFDILDDVLANITFPSSSSNFDFDILDDILANITLPSSSSNFDSDIPDDVLANITLPSSSSNFDIPDDVLTNIKNII